MREERIFHVSRWLSALALVFIPLSIVVLISVVFAYNYPDRQWIRYLLLFSWISTAVSALVGIINMVGMSLSDVEGEGAEDQKEVDRRQEEELMVIPERQGGSQVDKDENRGSGSYQESLVFIQAFTLGVGIALYVAFLCWILLPGIKVQM